MLPPRNLIDRIRDFLRLILQLPREQEYSFRLAQALFAGRRSNRQIAASNKITESQGKEINKLLELAAKQAEVLNERYILLSEQNLETKRELQQEIASNTKVLQTQINKTGEILWNGLNELYINEFANNKRETAEKFVDKNADFIVKSVSSVNPQFGSVLE